jgi:hypothetical protein
MSSIKDYIPMDIEISQIELDRKSTEHVQRLLASEEGVMKSVKDLADKFDKMAKDRKSYHDSQFEISRNYIQLVNRKSTIFQQNNLTNLKEHLRRNEESIGVINEMTVNFQQLSDSYKEYVGNLKELSKAWEKFTKTEQDWYGQFGELQKAKDRQEAGKMDKIEKGMVKLKQDVEKTFSEKNHRSEFVEKSVIRVNQMWNKLKLAIKNISW